MPKKAEIAFTEFILLMALMSALIALAIDAALPALGQIGDALGVTEHNDNQLIISVLFAGMALGQVIYGPLSDSIGRKRAIYIGFALFILGCIISLLSADLTTMLIGRFLQGLGAAGPRIVTVALIRDRYEGRAMARVMSFVMSIFIFVPAIAPALGQGVMYLWGWEAIFLTFLIIATLTLLWFSLRQEETLAAEMRVPFSLSHIYAGIKETCRNRTAFGYTIAMGLIFGAFVGYLSSAQQIFQDAYATGDAFVYYFALLALAIGLASFANGKLVMRYGMRPLSAMAVKLIAAFSALFFIFCLFYNGLPPFYAFMLYGAISFFCIGLLFGNLNAMAMEPLGHIAGVGAAVVGSLSTFISVPLGVIIGRLYDGGVLALVGGFAMLGAASALMIHYAGHAKMEEVVIYD